MGKKTSRIHAYQRIPLGIIKQQIEILKQNIRRKMRKSMREWKVQTHSKLQRRMQKKIGKVWRKCKKHILDHTRVCKLINARLLMQAY